jgi:hypothetical protein
LTEIEGVTNWVVFSEGQSVFAYDIVRNSDIQVMVTGLKDARAVAVDTNLQYLFVAD